MKFYKSRYFWFFAISLLIVSFLFYSLYFNSRNQILGLTDFFNSEKTSVEVEKPLFTHTKTSFFLPIAGIKSTRSNINLSEALNLEFLTIEGSSKAILEIKDFQDIKIKEVADFDTLSKSLNSNLNSVGILNFDDMSFRVKALSFENILLLKKNPDIEKYALKNIERITSDQDIPDQSNFDPKLFTVIGHTGSIIGARGTQYTAETRFKGDYTKLFASTKTLFDKMDFVSGTMEAPILGKGRECDRCMAFVGPEKLMDGIKYAGIDLLSTAANHIMDGGDEGLANTQKKIAEAGILQLGSSLKNNDEAGKPILAEINGVKIAYIAFNDTPGRNQWAGPNKSGAANISDWEVNANGQTIKYEPNEERIKFFMQRAKDLNPDLIFVLPHWGGQEYTQKPLAYTRKLAQLLVKHGADAILGDHPHWIQEMEYIDGKPVWYCVGNYVFDQTWSEETMQGFTIELNIYNSKIINYRLHPHYAKVQGVPELLAPSDPKYQNILNRVWNVSELE